MRKIKFKTNTIKEGNKTMRKISLILALTMVAMLVMATAAFAAHEGFDPNARETYANSGEFNKRLQLGSSCDICHAGTRSATTAAGYLNYGPHGGYTSTTTKCSTCHTVHSNIRDMGKVETSALLPSNTVTSVCNFCHDLTAAARAPYYTSYMTGATGSQPKSAHRVEGIALATNTDASTTGWQGNKYVYGAWDTVLSDKIPGGDSATGGGKIYKGTFDQGKMSNAAAKSFTCDSCHTPHGLSANVVNGYYGESARVNRSANNEQHNRLLKNKLYIGQTTPVNDYGSAWCASCHQGRLAMGEGEGYYNHPVNKTGPGYMTLEIFNANKATVKTATYYKTNAWFAMEKRAPGDTVDRPDGYVPYSYFQTGNVDTNGPSCQQCHASARDVEAAWAAPGAASGPAFSGNPGAQTFPHVSINRYLLVEDGDDLCTNCHGETNLP